MYKGFKNNLVIIHVAIGGKVDETQIYLFWLWFWFSSRDDYCMEIAYLLELLPFLVTVALHNSLRNSKIVIFKTKYFYTEGYKVKVR